MMHEAAAAGGNGSGKDERLKNETLADLLSSAEREALGRLYVELEDAKLDARRAKVRCGAVLIEIQRHRLWRGDYASFEDFLVDRCGSKSTGYRWMNAASTALEHPDKPWLETEPMVAAALYALRHEPHLQAEIARHARDAHVAEVIALVRTVKADEPLLNRLATEPGTDFDSALNVIVQSRVGAMMQRVEQMRAEPVAVDQDHLDEPATEPAEEALGGGKAHVETAATLFAELRRAGRALNFASAAVAKLILNPSERDRAAKKLDEIEMALALMRLFIQVDGGVDDNDGGHGEVDHDA